MNVKKKIGLAMATTALGATLLAGGSFALFTSSASTAGNTFTAGTLTIADFTGGAVFASSQLIGNLAPGDHEDGVLTIKNTGSLDAWVAISGVVKSDSQLFWGGNALQITYPNTVVKIAAGATASLPVSYSLPLAAGNEYQNASGTVTFNVAAVQVRNNENDAHTGPNSWGM
jgi:spore coat-associated protein N